MTISYILNHLFFPGISNNQKAKILHGSTIFIFIFFLVAYQIILQFLPATGVNILGYAANIPPSEIVSLTNQKRTESGLGSLSWNDSLASAARMKGQHMLANNYWAHIAPDGTEPWKFFIDSGYRYRYAGENLARDFSNAPSAVDAWMASPTHKENLLSAKYDEIGVAVVEGMLDGVETTIIVQLFGKRYSDIVQEPLAQAGAGTAGTSAQINPTAIPIQPTLEPTAVPTATPTLVPTPTPQIELIAYVQDPPSQVLISPFTTTKGISIITTTMLLGILVIDGYIVSKRKISRISGRTFAHLAFLGMILTIAIIAQSGSIL